MSEQVWRKCNSQAAVQLEMSPGRVEGRWEAAQFLWMGSRMALPHDGRRGEPGAEASQHTGEVGSTSGPRNNYRRIRLLHFDTWPSLWLVFSIIISLVPSFSL